MCFMGIKMISVVFHNLLDYIWHVNVRLQYTTLLHDYLQKRCSSQPLAKIKCIYAYISAYIYAYMQSGDGVWVATPSGYLNFCTFLLPILHQTPSLTQHSTQQEASSLK